MELNKDGSVKGETFSKKSFTGTGPKIGETYRQYNERIGKLKEEGFHLGDLSWSNWITYCMGSGSYEGANADEQIY